MPDRTRQVRDRDRADGGETGAGLRQDGERFRARRVDTTDARAVYGQLPERRVAGRERARQILSEDVSEVLRPRIGGGQHVTAGAAQIDGSPARQDEQDSERQRSDDELAIDLQAPLAQCSFAGVDPELDRFANRRSIC